MSIPCTTEEECKALASAKAAQYSDPANAAALMAGSGGSLLGEITKYVYGTCAADCGAPSKDFEARPYEFRPSPGAPWAVAWEEMMKNVAGTSLEESVKSFTFQALPPKDCPYEAMYCVPFPGLEFDDIADYCTPKMNDAAKEAAGAAMGAAMDGIAASGATEAVESNFGTMIGDLQTSLDVFIIVCILSLIVGFTFLVILRYTVGCVVWASIVLVFLLFVL